MSRQFARKLGLAAGKAAEVLDAAYKQQMDQTMFKIGLLREQQARQFQEKMARQKQLFEAEQDAEAAARQRENVEYREEQAAARQRENVEYREEQATAREQMGIEAGKYDKTGRWSYWSKLNIDPKAKMILSGTNETLRELYDIETVMRNKIFITPADREMLKDVQARIRQLETRKNIIYEETAPKLWEKIQSKLELYAPKSEPEKIKPKLEGF